MSGEEKPAGKPGDKSVGRSKSVTLGRGAAAPRRSRATGRSFDDTTDHGGRSISTLRGMVNDAVRRKKHWIEEHIFCRECSTIIPDPKNEGKCQCGLDEDKHGHSAEKQESGKWDYTLHSNRIPCNAFGRIKFLDEDVHQQPEFARVDVDYQEPGRVGKIMELLDTSWNLPSPNLLISVTGGAKDFNVNPDLLEEFKRGLKVAAKTTNAWVITGGTSTGIMKLVGEALRGSSGTAVPCIGIATWGIIKNRNALKRSLVKKNKKGVFDYGTNEKVAGGEAYLDSNHTHFLLADNGTTGRFGSDVMLRGMVEAAICEKFSPDFGHGSTETMALPMICILVEGGPNSLATCLAALNQGNPVLILSGTGRAADLISYALKEVTERVVVDVKSDNLTTEHVLQFKVLITNEIKRLKLPDSQIETMFINLQKLLIKKHLITVYNFQAGDDKARFSEALMDSMMKAYRNSDTRFCQMMLAISWQRLIKAQHLIHQTDLKFSDDHMQQFLKQSILLNRVEFVDLLLKTDLELRTFLTYGMLRELYNHISPKTQTLGKRLKTGTSDDGVITLSQIGRTLEGIIEGRYRSEWASTNFNFFDVEDTIVNNPYDVMVVYCVFMQYHEMAKLFWRNCKEPIVTGLISAKLNWYLSEFEGEKLACDEDTAEELHRRGCEFEGMAQQVILKCYKEFERKEWTMVLTSQRKSVNNMTIIDLAQNINATCFLAEAAIQSHMNRIWMGEIHHTTPLWAILFVCICQPLLFIIRYNKKPLSPEERDLLHEEMLKKEANEMGEDVENIECKGNIKIPERRKRNWKEKIIAFYNAPVIKFVLHFMTYLLFLIGYAYRLLHFAGSEDLVYSKLSVLDIFLCLWILGQLPNEIHQINTQNPLTLKDKLKVHYASTFNIMDTLAILTFWTQFVIKAVVPESEVHLLEGFTIQNTAHVINVFSFALLSLRFIQVVEVNINMGPKVIMIKKMMIDLVLFLFLLFIFLITYGICSQALKDPTSLNFDSGRLCLLPALNIFGEIGLEDLEADVLEGHCVEPVTMTMNETCVETYSDDFLDFVNGHNVVWIHYYILQALMFGYLVFVNVLLLNLLIAIFSNTYESINSEASKIWKVQWCYVVKEFEQRQPLPNPLSLIYYIYVCCQYCFNPQHIKSAIYRVPCGCCGRFRPEPKKPAAELDDYQLLMLIADARVEYSNELQENENNDTGKSLRFIKDKLISLDHRMSEMERRGYQSSAPASQPNDNSEVFDILQGEHKDSRKTPYIGSSVERYPVNDRFVSWDVPFPEEEVYNPPDYTSQTVLDTADKLEADPDDPRDILGTFNDIEKVGDLLIDRTSFIRKYKVSNGYPKNPQGRTGLRGRGQLHRWGPNPTAEPIITRWARDSAGAVIKMNGLPVLEFVGVFLREAECWSIPGGPIRHGEHLTVALNREFSEDALGSLSASEAEKKATMAMLREHLELGIAVYKGYVDDPRNTDNAWVETSAINYHDSLGTSFSKFPLQRARAAAEGETLGETVAAEWIALNKNVNLYGNHEWILEKVCFHRHAFNPFTTHTKQTSLMLAE